MTTRSLAESFPPNSKLNIGLLCGSRSGMVVLDFDDPEAYLAWCDEYPAAAKTYTVQRDNAPEGRCHCYFTLQSDNPAPASSKGPWGDFLSDGKQVVAPPSTHYTSGKYQVVKPVPPLPWHEEYIPSDTGSVTKRPRGKEQRVQEERSPRRSRGDVVPEGRQVAEVPDVDLILASARLEEQHRKEHPEMAHLYDILVDRRVVAEPRQRNTVLTEELIPFLFDAVGREIGLEFAGRFYEFNQNVFRDPLSDHMRQAHHVWNALEEGYNDRLNEIEREVYGILDQRGQELFRIARSLALDGEKNPGGPGSLNLPQHHIGIRLGFGPRNGSQVGRLIIRFRKYGIVGLVEKGAPTRHDGEKTIQGEPTIYRWLL